MGNEVSAFTSGLGIAFVISFAVWIVVAVGGGATYLQSMPIATLSQGNVYEVCAIVKSGGDCYLLLRFDNQIKYYQLPAKDLPTDLEVGDGLIKTSVGIERLSHRFDVGS